MFMQSNITHQYIQTTTDTWKNIKQLLKWPEWILKNPHYVEPIKAEQKERVHIVTFHSTRDKT